MRNNGEDTKDGHAPYHDASQYIFRLPHGTRLELSEAVFQLSMMFWTYQCQDGVMDSSAIVHFTAVMGIHRSSLAYRDAYSFTPDLAALIWVGRLLFLEYSLPRYSYDTLVYPWPARHTYSSQPERLEAIRKKYMLRGCYSPLSELIELKAFGKSIVRREGVRGTLTWAPDGRSFTIGDGKVVRLSEFCATYRAAITRVEELVTEMMLGWDPTVDLSAIRDDLTCRFPGWCFLDKPENHLSGTYKAMSRRAWSSSFRGKALAKAGHWLPDSCLAYLQTGAELSTKAFSAVHITAGLPGRGTEMTTIRLRNTKLAIRNLFIREGRAIIVISYTKARSSNNHAFYIVRYLPDDLGLSVVVYLAYIRPFLDFLANQLGLPHYHSNEFLFLDPKHKERHLSTTQATESLRDLTRTLQTPWTISLYRQASIAIAKRHISELIKERNFYYPSDANTSIRMIAAGVGHRPRMLLTAYAIDTALPTRLQPELLEMYRQLSTLWQNWNSQYYDQYCAAKCSGVTENAAGQPADRKQSLENNTQSNIRGQKKRGFRDLSSEACRKKSKVVSTSATGHEDNLTTQASVEEFPKGFIYNREYQILICVACESVVSPGKRSFYHHLNRHRILGPVSLNSMDLDKLVYNMMGEQLRGTIELLSTYDLRGAEELRQQRPHRRRPCEIIDGLTEYGGFICMCDVERCDFVTTRLELMHDHMPRHGRTASQNREGSPLWEACRLQTYLTAKGRIDYFTVKGSSDSGRDSNNDNTPPLGRGIAQPPLYTGPPPSAAEETLFDGLRGDLREAARDLEDKAAVVEDAGRDRADRQPWLVHTGFPTHLRGLLNTEIWSSFKLPKKKNMLFQSGRTKVEEKTDDHGIDVAGDDGEDEGEEEDLRRILTAADALFESAYTLVSDRSPNRKMTQQRAQILSDFAWGAGKKGKDTAFRRFKNPSSLAEYFRTMKQLLVYYYRVVYCEDGHFSRPQEVGREEDDNDDEEADEDGHAHATEAVIFPQDVIEPTGEQQEAMTEMFRALREEDHQGTRGGLGEERRRKDGNSNDGKNHYYDHHDSRLACAIRRFYIGLICHEVGSVPFRSPVISFCAMLSRGTHKDKSYYERERRRKRETKSRRSVKNGKSDGEAKPPPGQEQFGVWAKPGNYTSNLSKLVWVAQLLIFETACFYKRHQEEDIPATLEKICRDFMHQKRETAFGYILQWRLYLRTVAQAAITSDQARWSLDGQEIDFRGIKLRMEHVPQLVVSEYRRARSLLYDKLMFGAKDVPSIEAWMLHDDLDAEDHGGSWLTDERNAEYLRGTQDALLRQVEQRADLRQAFVRDDQGRTGGKTLCSQAMAVYECEAQEFLKSMITLLHVPPAPPLRAPELLTTTYANGGGRRRSMLIWEKMLFMYVRYHKSQEQTEEERDNIRFVPSRIADLLVTFLAIVQPLRQTFLRQARPRALLSTYLWSTLDGDVWRDDLVSKYLSQACLRAEVPEFKVAWWRQAAASITKEKFTPKEQANFNMEDVTASEVIDEEELLVDLAVASNHAFKTFNQMYAGSSTLVMNTPLHRAHRASRSWRELFRIDEHLSREEAAGDGGKRMRSGTDMDMVQMCKRTKLRTRPLGKVSDLEAVARALYNNPSLRFRRPGQRNAMLATMGRHAAEQVVVVLATGSGKTLIAMVGAALDGAGTTIVVLPAVALRENMLDRLGKVGIKTIVWEPGQLKSAPLVIVSAEAACTITFLDYAQRLQSRQRLDRVIIDECHLTITAAYRKSMKKLGSYVRQIATQTVWMTATLPPSLESVFIQQNRLVQPRMVRESTNRANIRDEDGDDDIVGNSHKTNSNGKVTGGRMSRIIVYCQTLDLMEELAKELDCPMYTGDEETMSDGEKDLAIEKWRGSSGSPVIVATAALGVGFDYPEVRWVVHAGAPRSMTAFSQESGRAGRDNKPAESITLISEAWQPRRAGQEPKDLDEEMMQLYLTQQHCSRAVMSQFLDKRSDWRWCMEGEDELCAVCPRPHAERRPANLELGLPSPKIPQPATTDEGSDDDNVEGEDKWEIVAAREMVYTGPDEVLRQARVHNEVLRRFEEDLEIMRGCCLLCRVREGRPFDHSATSCGHRWPWIKAKKKVIQACEKEGKQWMEDFTACFMCYLPQTICRRADPEAEPGVDGEEGLRECRFRDMIMPLCYGAFFQAGLRALIKKHFPHQTFRDVDEYMRWLGKSATLGDIECVQAVSVAAKLLDEFR
ncbi:tlh3 [Metarhizium robertsii ARSEF 23]|uniref:DNA 3'-5' helicase n=1 Tax=Metarhizium robertsii (strain ARSEF 23 / ATCC MYA-3075) TaxID=655844 RepID=E9EMV3_METRA|nr:tlh3 [Metarhizium robertsii ARSEF 23]EFZ03297.2 tlh3 [Metarhizium robertsii ARSEF 23]